MHINNRNGQIRSLFLHWPRQKITVERSRQKKNSTRALYPLQQVYDKQLKLINLVNSRQQIAFKVAIRFIKIESENANKFKFQIFKQ